MKISVPGRSRSALAALLALLVVTALAASGCFAGTQTGGNTSGDQGAATRDMAVAPGAAGVPAAEPMPQDGSLGAGDAVASKAASGLTAETEKLVVVNKTMRLTVDKVNDAISKIRAMVARDGGDITSLQVSTSTDEPVFREQASPDGTVASGSAPLQAFVTVRIPAKAYGRFLAEAAKLGEVTFQSETAEDVTQQHVDMTARLTNLRAEEARLRQFLAKARNVREMLEVERELSRVRGEIESMQAQLDYLEKQAAMATVTLELAEPKPVVRPQGQDWGVGDAVTTGIRGLVGLINLAIVAIISTAPLWVLALVIVGIIVAVRRRRRSKRAAAAPDASPPAE